MGRNSIFMACFLTAGLLFPSTGHAYLDPGTGSIVLQAIIGSIAAGGAVLGLYWQKLKSYFAKDKAAAGHSGEKDKA